MPRQSNNQINSGSNNQSNNQSNNRSISNKKSDQFEHSANPLDQFSDVVNQTVENMTEDDDNNTEK